MLSQLPLAYTKDLPPNIHSFAAKYMYIWRQIIHKWRQNKCVHRRSKEHAPEELWPYTVRRRKLYCTNERLAQVAQAICTHGERRWGSICFRKTQQGLRIRTTTTQTIWMFPSFASWRRRHYTPSHMRKQSEIHSLFRTRGGNKNEISFQL